MALVSLLLATLLLTAPLQRTVFAQGQNASASLVNENTRLKRALSAALDRIEDSDDKIGKAAAYIDKLEQEQLASEKVIDAYKQELASLIRLRELDKEEAAKLRSAISHLEAENKELRVTIGEQSKTIVKQNQKLSTARKLTIFAFIAGAVGGFLLGGRR